MKKMWGLGVIALLLLTNTSGFSQQNSWKVSTQVNHPNAQVLKGLYAYVQENDVKLVISKAGNNIKESVSLTLPAPDGTQKRFQVYKNDLLPSKLNRKYEHIITANGVGEHNSLAKIDFTDFGFRAMIFDIDGTYLIEPTDVSGQYLVYYKSDAVNLQSNEFDCLISDDVIKAPGEPETIQQEILERSHGNIRKKYQLALACTGEYAVAIGGSDASKSEVLSAMVTTINRVNGIYEREIAVTLQFIDNQDTLIYLDPTTDPYESNFNGFSLMFENQSNISSVIPTDQYDIGHIFSTGGGGIAYLASVCRGSHKAKGVTGRATPLGDVFDVDFVAHEIGHQFGAEHTFNQCSGTESEYSAYEPGGGTTIMAYAGICGAVNNVARNSDDYFHTQSLSQISMFLSGEAFGSGGSGCGEELTGSTPITVGTIDHIYNIPMYTPFELTADSVEGDGVITYAWEQWDLGDFQRNEPVSVSFTTGPVFRSYFPSLSPIRTFPRIDSLVKGKSSFAGSRYPNTERLLSFKLTARQKTTDGWGTFDISDDELKLQLVNTGNPFTVTYPNATEILWLGGTTVNIEWEVANTDLAPINAANVDIFLSLDGGLTYSKTIALGVPNSGAFAYEVTDEFNTDMARIKVKGSDNVFFNISSNNFNINKDLGIEVAQKESLFNLFPNPARELIHVKTDYSGKMNFKIINLLGQSLKQGDLGENQQININTFTDGVYFIQLFNSKNILLGTQQLIILN